MNNDKIPKTATEAWLQLIADVSLNGRRYSPRGMPVREIINNTVAVDMAFPVVLTKKRRLSYRFMAAEAWWILAGRRDVESIGRYCSAIKKFSDDGETFFGAYGPKIARQVEYVVNTLKRDRDTRQAVLTIWRENPPHTKDVPCTVAVQWLIRDGLLHCVDTMRSSDVWLGFPYDVFNFSMLSWHILEALRDEDINVQLGTLHLNAGSHHIYEKDLETLAGWHNHDWSEGHDFDAVAGHRIERGFVHGYLAAIIGEYSVTPNLNEPHGFFESFQTRLLNTNNQPTK
jgi:thymidylate synthase